MMRVAMIEAGGWGGICHYTYNLCQALARTETRTTLVTAAPYEIENLPRGFELEPVLDASATYRTNLDAIRAALRRIDPDVVHVQSTLSARKDWAAMWWSRRIHPTLGVTAHNILPHDRAERDALGMRLAHEMIYDIADWVIVHGQGLKDQLVSDFRVPPGRVHVIPHGDYAFARSGAPRTRAEARRRLSLAETGRVVLFFGAIREYKGVPDLIDAFARVSDRGATLAIAGALMGMSETEIRDRIDTHGLGDRVVFRPGYVPFEDVATYFEAADVVAFPYRSIYQRGALQLAYAFGLPVVATRVGALTESVEHGGNGLLVDPGDALGLTGALDELLSASDETLAAMGRRSRERAKEHHSWEDAARRTRALYEEALRENRG